MSGFVKIIGLGPGSDVLLTEEVKKVIDLATDVVGYFPYVARIPRRDGLTLHASDNRQEIDRAKFALGLAEQGKRVIVVSSGDPGVFAMASAVFEAVENGEDSWTRLDIEVLPGITAMLAASARAGAPLGHDFCCINLSDNLKPWSLIEKRVHLATQADFAMAFYNPSSKSRPEGFEKILNQLTEECEDNRILIFAKNVSKPNEEVLVTTLADAKPEMADMRTLVIVGSSQTRKVPRTEYVYTPRFVSEVSQ